MYRALRVFGDGQEIVTASPSVICVWENTDTVNKIGGMVAGPFMVDPAPKTDADLVDWYRQWVREGRKN